MIVCNSSLYMYQYTVLQYTGIYCMEYSIYRYLTCLTRYLVCPTCMNYHANSYFYSQLKPPISGFRL